MDTSKLRFKKILYIEDDFLLSKMLQKKMSEFSCQVEVAVNGREGLALLENRSFDVILLDYLMPVLNGLEVLHEFKSAKTDFPPVIFVTGIGDEKVAVEAMKLGASDYVIKDLEGCYLNLLPMIICRILEKMEMEERNIVIESQLLKLSSVVEQSPGVVIITDKEGKIEYVNPQFTYVTGYPLEEVLGKNPKFLKSGYSNPEIYDGLWSTILSGGIWRGIFHNKTKSGDFYWGLACISPLKDSQGVITHFIGIQEDITKQKETENALIVALEQAEASNKSKTEFLQNMSHDLRTPLNGILGYTQILKRDKSLSQKHRHEVNIIEQCGYHLLSLINDILDLSRIEEGNIDLIEDEFNLPDFLFTIVEIMEVSAHKKGLSFVYDVSRVPKLVTGDETRLRQILINLLNNAIKYSEEGRVDFRANRRGEKVRFEIEDTGIGIKKEDLDEIFLPFHQIVGKKDYSEGGAGLGLAICKKLINLMHSKLHVTSEVKKGTCFWFDLELSVNSERDEMTLMPKIQESAFAEKKNKILVVDDSKGNLSLLREVLSQWGFKVFEADCGEDAVQLAVEKKPDLVLMDIKMIGMDGYQAAHLMKTNDSLKDIVIIAVSAMAFVSDKEYALKAGFDDYITKPVKQAELLSVLNSHLFLDGVEIEKSHYGEEDGDQGILIVPQKMDLKTLLEYAKRGDVGEIGHWADKIEEMNKEYTPFIKKIREFANTFQIDEIIKIVEKDEGLSD